MSEVVDQDQAGGLVSDVQLDGLNTAATGLLHARGIDGIVDVVVHHGVHVLGAEAVALVLGDPFAAEASYHLHDDSDLLDEGLAAELAQQTYQGGIAERVLAGLSYGDGFSPAMAATPFRSALCYPLRVHDQYVGTLLLLRTGQQPDFSHGDLKVGALYSAALALALENLRLAGKFQSQTVVDEMTGLYSRRYLFETLWQLLKRLTRSDPPVLTCLGVGIDDGEALQAKLDRSGLERLVKRVARLLGRTVRASDVVARTGQLAFTILLPMTDVQGGRLVADKIRAIMAAEATDPLPVTVGIGIAGYDLSDKAQVRSMKDASDLSAQLLQGVEMALRQAQADGPDRVAVWKG